MIRSHFEIHLPAARPIGLRSARAWGGATAGRGFKGRGVGAAVARRRTGVRGAAQLRRPEAKEEQHRYARLRKDDRLRARVSAVGDIVGDELGDPSRQREQELTQPHDELPVGRVAAEALGEEGEAQLQPLARQVGDTAKGAAGDERFHGLYVAALRCQHERGDSVLISCIDIRLCLE